MRILLLLLLAVLNVWLRGYLIGNPDFYQLDAYTWETDAFRSMRLGEAASELSSIDMDGLTAAMLEHDFDLTGLKREEAAGLLLRAPLDNPALQRRKTDYRKLKNAYAAVLSNLKYFPVPASIRADTPDIRYEDGWMESRTYGGQRSHEGCDIMGTELPRGTYPVVSISDGVVEKAGWLEKGGWRIGIRAPSGLYLYYAHLYDYAQDWQEGDLVKAGQLLGFMGDSGYSAVPGTVGNFETHLHVGMYLRTDHYEEMSVNPYWILKYLEKYRLKYDY